MNRRLHLILQTALVGMICLQPVWGQEDAESAAEPVAAPTYEELKAEGERLHAEKSYSLARTKFEEARKLELTPEQARWIDFRLADTLWRSSSVSRQSDLTPIEEAREALTALANELTKLDGALPQLYAEVQESLGDSWWSSAQSQNWHQGWQYYQKALEWWEGSKEVDTARERYLKIVWKASGRPAWHRGYYSYGYYGNRVPVQVLENVLKIAVTPADQAHAHYLMAMTLQWQGGSPQQRLRVSEEFEAALSSGARTEWNDDALFNYAQWSSHSGLGYYDENGDLRLEADYEKAVALYRRILEAYQQGESRYYNNAKRGIEQIIDPQLNVQVSNIFLPGSQPRINLNWRNVEEVTVNIYPLNLSEDIEFDRDEHPNQWINGISIEEKEAIKTLTEQKKPERQYYPLSSELRLDTEVPIGAYLVVASGGGKTSRDLLLVSGAALVLKATNSAVLAYLAEASNGAPIPEAKVVLWEHFRTDRDWRWRRHTQTTNAQGLAHFTFPEKRQQRQYFVTARTGERQTFALSNNYYGNYSNNDQWKIYAYTDRPAYRPDETAHWKIVVRAQSNDAYKVPTDERLRYEIQGPRGNSVDKGEVTLNAFGTAWGELDLNKEMDLGSYQITFYRSSNGRHVGSAALFRLEEYKLPEFKVEIGIGAEGAESQEIFRVGDVINGNIQADYYFGGPVPNADVELVVYQRPFYHWFRPYREYDWYYDDIFQRQWNYYGGRGQVVKQESLKTDSTGAVGFSFATPQYSEQDYEYTVEARVVDASRREILASKAIKVTRQGYYVSLDPEHQVYQAGDRAEITIRTVDANDRPVSAEGRLRLTRERWREVWIDRKGREISGEQMKELRQKSGRFFSFGAEASDYRLKEEGYEIEEIEVTRASTDENGETVYAFTVPRDGYYRIAWVSRDKNGQPIKSDTAIWAAKDGATEIGYRPGGVSIIVDKDTFRVGEKAPVMITVPASGRYVLFTVGAEDLLSYELLKIEGTVKLVRLDVKEEHVPNSYLEALMVNDTQLFMEQKQIVVPPVKNFLNVDVAPDADGYQPQGKGTYTVKVTDENGNPVSTEVSLGLVDEAVYYIQPELAPDIRQFFFGEKRYYGVTTQSTFNYKPVFRFDETDDESDANRLVGGVEDMDFLTKARSERRSNEDFTVMESAEFTDAYNMAPAPPVLSMASLAQDANALEAPGAEPNVVVRTDFRSTVFWQPDIVTGEDGTAQVDVKFPDSLTTWKATARAVGQVNRFGSGTSDTQTRLPLIARLQAPRFFVIGDRLLVSGVFNNNTNVALPVRAKLEISQGLEIVGYVDDDGELVEGMPADIVVPANAEKRVDWQVRVTGAGDTKIKLTGAGRDFGDAMEKTYPVYEHGISKFAGKSGKVRGDSVTVTLDIPAERKKESTRLEVQVTPSIAVTMLDALPYLIDYPYGCTEQTMSRFLPAVIVAKTLRDMGLKPGDIAGKVFGGIEQEYATATHAKGKRDLGELKAMTRSGLDRLGDFQHADGGWGWWKKGDSDPFMTAYVVWGLTLAEQAGVDVDAGALKRARGFLQKKLVEAEFAYDLQAWMLHALASRNVTAEDKRPERFEATAFLNLMKNRDQLNAYTKALLALSAHYFEFEEDAAMLVRNLRDGAKVDNRPDQSVLISSSGGNNGVMGTAHWGEDGIYWRWSDGGVEATSFVLMAFLTIDPNNDLIEPVMNWLVKNRRGAQWSNTRDTAITVLALNQYLRTSGELNTALEYELRVNGETVADASVGIEDMLAAPSSYSIDNALIQDGANRIEILRKGGDGPIYFSVHAEYFSLEEPLPAAGNEIFVKRDYYQLSSVPTLLKGYVEEKEKLEDGATINSGDRIEVVLTIEGKNNYEYLLFEDLKPSGFETVQIRSGEPLYARELKAKEALVNDSSGEADAVPMLDDRDRFTGRQRWVHQELRDRHVACFIDKLPEGYWEIRYLLRAETPGEFHSLPALGHAMYVPEIRANSSEFRISVEEDRDTGAGQ